MNTSAYDQALATVGTSWDALNTLYKTDIKKWAEVSQEVSDLVHESHYEFKTEEVGQEIVLRIQTPRFHPSSPHWGKHFGDHIYTKMMECEGEMTWNGYQIPERNAIQAKNAIWCILAENDALDLL